MKKLYAFLILVSSCFFGNSQSLQWVQSNTSDGCGAHQYREVVYQNSIYATGTICRTVDFGEVPFPIVSLPTTNGGLFLTKYDVNGYISWMKIVATPALSSVQATGMVADATGNIY